MTAEVRDHTPQTRDFTNPQIRRRGAVNEVEHGANHNMSTISAKVEQVFATVKHLWDFAKVRYRALAKLALRECEGSPAFYRCVNAIRVRQQRHFVGRPAQRNYRLDAEFGERFVRVSATACRIGNRFAAASRLQ